MIREYCDKCHKEIAESKFVQHPGEDFKRWTITRYEIKVIRGPDRDHGPIKGENFDWTVDVLCPDCAREFRVEVEA